ncbi:MAG: bifunctional precorrin-2 dehydrogenase/sirohydrochlorin ferrochelatase [Ruminococcus sp.]|nr:bifunctional precorrin-2 dehydrogenase/sirohydrochlorin ferrochelatase [Ruminococcus sp.]
MGYFPFYIDIENKKCVVVGGGTVALRKVEKLLPFKPQITVVAPEICNELSTMAEVEIVNREFRNADIDNAFMVISATDDNQLNANIFNLCKSKNIFINTVDDKEKCGFIFPALVKKDNVTIGISTSGKSPLYSRFLREKIENSIDNNSDKIIDVLSNYRLLIKTEIKSEEKRKKAFEHILKICLENIENVSEEKILKIIEDFK